MLQPSPVRNPSATARPGADRRVFVAGALIVLAIAVAYANSVSGTFVYDDKSAIV